MLPKKKKKSKNKDGELEDDEDEVMMAQLAAKGAGTLQYTKPADQPLLEIEKKPDPQESEEWKKFNDLLNKTQQTVSATQTKMSQLADSSVAAATTDALSSDPSPAPNWESFKTEEEQPVEEEQQSEAVPEPVEPEPERVPEPVPETVQPEPEPPAQVVPQPQPVPAASPLVPRPTPIKSLFGTPSVPAVEKSPEIEKPSVEPENPQEPPAITSFSAPSSAIARPRPKGAPGNETKAPEEPAVPDIFDTSKFISESSAVPAPTLENPFKTFLDEDTAGDDFFSKLGSSNSKDAWGGTSFLPLPKVFDTLQTHTDDERENKADYSSANNPFRSTAPDAFAAPEDDMFSQLANIGGGTSSASAAGGAEWDEFDPFCDKKPQSAPENFKADFGKSRKTRKGSQDSSGSSSVVEYEDGEEEALTPLEPFHDKYQGQWFQMGLRQPPRKSKMPFTAQRGWRTTYVRIETEPKNGNVFVRLYLTDKDATAGKNPLHELKLDPYMTLSEIGMQPFDEYGKVYTTKIFRTDYKERPALRTDKITPKGLALTSIKDWKRLITKPKTTMVLDHAPQHEEMMKLGSLNYQELKQYRWYFEDAMMKVITKRQQTSQQYTKDEIIAEIVDEYEANVDRYGHITDQKARVRIYCLSFLSGMAFVEFGVNDIRRKGKEVVRRQDIIPMRTEQWIRIENYEFHCCVNQDEFNKSTVIRFQPPDGINVEILRFRVRPRKNFQLPLQVRAVMNVDKTNKEVEIRMEVLIPGYFSNSRKANQAPCENIAISFPIPEPWIYYFRVEHVWGYGSVHATRARPGKVKGLERITNMAEGLIPKTTNPSGAILEVNTGDCKYEHLLNGLVWRIPRLPERFQGAYKTHLMTVKIPLGPHDPIPDSFETHVTVDYTMPATAVSRAMIRSISSTSQADEPPDKWVKQLARFYYKVEIERTFDVIQKGEATEQAVGIELPASIAPGMKVEVTEKPVQPGLAASDGDDDDSSDEEAAANRRQKAAATTIELGASAAAAAAVPAQSEVKENPQKIAISDEDSEEDSEEEEKPKFKIQLNPVIQSFIEKGGAMMNGAMKKPGPPHPEPPRPPPPRPLSPPERKYSDSSDEDEPEKAHPKRPPPPRPVAPHADGATGGADGGGKKWTVIAAADSPAE